MLTYTNYRSFAEVVAHYDRITPLRGAQNKGKDIRPIGDRSRKYERIVKISPNCYALSDGYHIGDEHFGHWYRRGHFTPTLADMEKYAPIVWRKKRDGTEEVTLRNGCGPSTHNSRYSFLDRYSPIYMWFRTRNGKHFIETGGREYYLAKSTTMPKQLREAHAHKQYYKWATTRDDNSSVKFIRTEGGWQHVEGTGRSLPKAPTVNKGLKAKFKDDIKKFFDWGMAMSPLLPLEDREYFGTQMADLYASYEQKPSWQSLGLRPAITKSLVAKSLAPAIARAVVRDDQHDARLALWVFFAKNCTDGWSWNTEYLVKTVKTKEDLAKVRSRYNTFINEQLGFMQK